MFISYGRSFAYNENHDHLTHISQRTVNGKVRYVFTLSSGRKFAEFEEDLSPRGRRVVWRAFEPGGEE